MKVVIMDMAGGRMRKFLGECLVMDVIRSYMKGMSLM